MKIKCIPCKKDVPANRVDGTIIYPHRPDLKYLDFFQCPYCKNHVGTHKESIKPLGCIVSKEVKKARIFIHDLIDPFWKSGKMKRSQIYKKISDKLVWEYHTGNIRDIQEARKIYKICLEIVKETS